MSFKEANKHRQEIIELLEKRTTIEQISLILNQKYGVRGLSARTLRRYISEEKLFGRCTNENLLEAVSNAINEVGPYYGRRMLTGSLRSKGINACESRVRSAMIAVDPQSHQLRVNDGHRRFNPVPYNSQYFGHKLHIDLNEKLVHFGVVLVGAIDGYSGFILSLFPIYQKNCVDVFSMYREILLNHGIWDQLRVDHGREFFLMLKAQSDLRELRFNTKREPYVQSTSRMNRIIERVWHEVNQRINYRIKYWLVELVNNDYIDMNETIDKWCVRQVVITLVSIGLNRFQQSWNYHTIPNKGIPAELAKNKSVVTKINPDLVPSIESAVSAYNSEIGTISTESVEFKPFGENLEANSAIEILFNQEFDKLENVYNMIQKDNFNVAILYDVIQDHRRHYVNVFEIYSNSV